MYRRRSTALLTLGIFLLVCLGASAASAWTPTRAGLNDRRHNVMDMREARCIWTWPLKPLPENMTAEVKRQKWHGWEGVKVRTIAKGYRCSPRELGKMMAAARGWTGYLWTALDTRITGESGWNPCRHYPSTTNCAYAGPNACGIPQSHPCSKLLLWCGVSTIGACPVRDQIRWTLDYIAGRYGSPAGLPTFPASY